jgi:hypothetical protein
MVLHKEFNINDYKKDVSKLKNVNVMGLIYVQGELTFHFIFVPKIKSKIFKKNQFN